MKISEVRALQSGEIETKLDDSREELFKLRLQLTTGQMTDTSRVAAVFVSCTQSSATTSQLIAARLWRPASRSTASSSAPNSLNSAWDFANGEMPAEPGGPLYTR